MSKLSTGTARSAIDFAVTALTLAAPFAGKVAPVLRALAATLTVTSAGLRDDSPAGAVLTVDEGQAIVDALVDALQAEGVIPK